MPGTISLRFTMTITNNHFENVLPFKHRLSVLPTQSLIQIVRRVSI